MPKPQKTAFEEVPAPPAQAVEWETDDGSPADFAPAETEDPAETPAPDTDPADAEVATPEETQTPAIETEGLSPEEAVSAEAKFALTSPSEVPVDPDEVELSDDELAEIKLPADFGARIEAVLLTSDRPLTSGRIARTLDLRGAGRLVRQEIKALNAFYAESGRSFRMEEIAGTYQVMTLPEYAEVLGTLRKTRITNKLTVAGIETLAIIAYRQPVVRADIVAIRGVDCGEVLKTLMDHHLIKPVGRAETLGRPVLYGTTKRFLEVFGLSDLKDLPKDGAMRPPSL